MRVARAWEGGPGDRQRLIQVGLALGLAALAWVAQLLGAFESLDRGLLDTYFLVRGELQTSSPIVIVGIDYESLQRVGRRWPWPRSVHAQLLRELTAAGARVVAFDVLFLDDDPVNDAELGGAAAAAPAVVWGSSFGTGGGASFRLTEHRPPVAGLRVPSSSFGFVDLLFDPDGAVRRLVPFRHFGADVFESFAAVVASRYRHEPPLALSAAGARWPGPGGALVPTERDGSLLINFAGPPGTFPTVPYVRVLERAVAPETFRDKIVLVGSTGLDVDRFFTPFYSRWLPETRQPMAGVEVQANAVDMILRGGFLARAGIAWQLLLFLTTALAGSLLVGRWRAWAVLGALGATELGCLALGCLVFVAADRWLPVAGVLVATPLVWGALVFHRFVVARGEKELALATLERYASPDVVREVVARGVEPALGGTRQMVSVLFSDVRGFTGLSERLPPETLVQLLNRHFAAASEIVWRHGGTLDKFIGDAVMAFWGAPTPRGDHALCAVRAALEMQAAAHELDAWAREHLGESLRIGIGINTGAAVVGHRGSPSRLGYTAVGDPVNLASRVAALTREHDAEILMSQFSWELVKYEVDAEALGIVPVRGRKEPVGLYRVLGLKSGTG